MEEEEDGLPFLKETGDQYRALRGHQQERVTGLIRALSRPRSIERNPASDFATDEFAERFADVLSAHHQAAGSAPYTKEKFENELVGVLTATGHTAEKVPGQGSRDIS